MRDQAAARVPPQCQKWIRPQPTASWQRRGAGPFDDVARSTIERLTEIAMESQPDRDTIVDEAVGQTHGTAPPDSVREKNAIPPEEAARRNAPAPAAEAAMPEKTAASLGERVGDAYADAGNARQKRQENVTRPAVTKSGAQQSVADRVVSAGQQAAQGVSNRFSDQRFVTMVAAFGLGFVTAVVLQGRR